MLGGIGSGALWFDTSVFSAPAANEWGNVERRGLLTGPAYYNLDASIVKVHSCGIEARRDPSGLLQRAQHLALRESRTARSATRTSAASPASCRRPSARFVLEEGSCSDAALEDWQIGRDWIDSNPLGCRWRGLAVALCARRPRSLAQTRVDFQRDVRPILSDNCFLCHGPDASTRKANLRLDLHEDALAPRRNGAPIVPRQARAKPALQEDHRSRSCAADAAAFQPQDRSATQQKETLRRWIEQGAEWKKHWAFVAPVRPALPEVRIAIGPQRRSIGLCWRRSRPPAWLRIPKRTGARSFGACRST